MITLPFMETLTLRMKEKAPLIQVLLGPRQVGKTTGVQLWAENQDQHYRFASADGLISATWDWIEKEWAEAQQSKSILIIDEIQKVYQWSSVIKKLWDRDVHSKNPLKVILLGSASLQIQKGLHESLSGRFELIRAHHWDFNLTQKLRPMNLDTYLKFGGYPGSYRFIEDEDRFFEYVRDTIVNTVIGKDILHIESVRSPALFRQAFEVFCAHPGQVLSYNKVLGQLQEGGNTDLVKRYLELYEGAYLLRGVPRFSTRPLSRKISSPKIIPMCPSLSEIGSNQAEGLEKGRVFEAAVGARLIDTFDNVSYWSESDMEIDFVVKYKGNIYAVEVKSGKKKHSKSIEKFRQICPKCKVVVVTPENFIEFSKDPKVFFASK